MISTKRDAAREYVSGFALEILDELRIRIMESRLVLQALADEADLNLDELDLDLQTVQEAAREASEAASLVHQGALLDESWVPGFSRPRAIFARHTAAVRQGAPKLNPAPSMAGHLERTLWQLPIADDREDTVNRPKCAGMVRSTGLKCVSAAIRLRAGVFGTHCYSHATSAERAQYKVLHESLNAERSQAYTVLLNRQRHAGAGVAEQWLQHREARRQQVEDGDVPL